MASIRDLKKDINNVLGDIIEAVYVWEIVANKHNSKEANAIIDEVIVVFDELMAKVNNKKIPGRKAHLKQVHHEFEEKARGLIDKVNSLA